MTTDPSGPETEPDPTTQLDRIEKISQNARTTWFGLLGVLAFVGITLMSHKDADFFTREAATQLPLVNVQVPVTAFFIAAPILVATLYAYLHLYLITLWEALAKAPARPNGTSLVQAIYPWLLSQSAVRVRSWRRDDKSATPSAMSLLTVILSFLITWAAGLFILGRMWTESWPYHSGLLTTGIGVCLLIAGLIGVRSFVLVWDLMGPSGKQTEIKSLHKMPIWLIATSLVATPVVGVIGLERTQGGYHNPPWGVASAIMSEVQLTPRPADWKSFQLWVRDFRRAQIKEANGNIKDLPKPNQDPLIPTADEMTRWGLVTQALDAPLLKGQDLRRANLAGAFLPGVDLREADLSRANLQRAQLQGADMGLAEGKGFVNLEFEENVITVNLKEADLSRAEMQGANLLGAQMQGADMFGADMQGANLLAAKMQMAELTHAVMRAADLSAAGMQGANLYRADMLGANLVAAQMQGASLRFTQMGMANLVRAQMQGADLRFASIQDSDCTDANFMAAFVGSADLTCRSGTLRPNQLRLTVGNARTKLPNGLFIWSCLDDGAPEVAQLLDEINAAIDLHPNTSRSQKGTFRDLFRKRLFCDPQSDDSLRRKPYKLTYDPFEERFFDRLGRLYR